MLSRYLFHIFDGSYVQQNQPVLRAEIFVKGRRCLIEEPSGNILVRALYGESVATGAGDGLPQGKRQQPKAGQPAAVGVQM